MRNVRLLMISCGSALTAALAFTPTRAAGVPSAVYAITGARIHTVSGAPIPNGTVVVRNGVIEDVGPGITVPAGAMTIDAAGLNLYPGLIDMANSTPLEAGDDAAAAAAGRAGGGGGRGGGTQFATLEEAERAKRETILRPHYLAAENLRAGTPELQALASAGVTTVLAVPAQGIFKGQSALVNVVIPPDDPQISTLADYRRGLAVVKSPVALHVNMAGRGGGQGFPNSLLGSVAFTKQGFLDAQWQRDAEAAYQKGGGRGPRPVFEPVLDSMRPALAKQMPVAFDASEGREIDRALDTAAQFGLDPIIVGAASAGERRAELAAAKARVILSLNLPGPGGGGAPQGGGRGGGGGASQRQTQFQQNAPKVPAALAQANVPFAFTSGGAAPAVFVRNAGRVIKEGGLAADVVLRVLTLDAARLAGAADRTGSIERGKIANIVVTEGDLFDGGRVRHVFIDGRPIDLTEPPAAPGGGRGGRGGGR
jgi:hypothetical protein